MLFENMTEQDVKDLFATKKAEVEQAYVEAGKIEKKENDGDKEVAVAALPSVIAIRNHPVTFDQAGLISIGRGAETGLPEEVVAVWQATMAGTSAGSTLAQATDIAYEAVAGFIGGMADSLDAWDLNPALFFRDYGKQVEAGAPPDDRLVANIYRVADKMAVYEKAAHPGLMSYEDIVMAIQSPEQSQLPEEQKDGLQKLLQAFAFGGAAGILLDLFDRLSKTDATYSAAFAAVAKKLEAENNPEMYQLLINRLEDLAGIASAREALATTTTQPEVGAASPETVVEAEKNPTAIAAALETAKASKAKK